MTTIGATRPFPISQPILERSLPKTKYINIKEPSVMPASHGMWAAVPRRAGSPSLAAFEPESSKNIARINRKLVKPATTIDINAANRSRFSVRGGSLGSGSGSGASSGRKVVRIMMYRMNIEASMKPGIKDAVNNALIDVSVIRP